MDRIARATGIDPWRIRLINAYHNGDVRPHRKLAEDATLIETIQAAAELVGVELADDLKAMTSEPRNGGG